MPSEVVKDVRHRGVDPERGALVGEAAEMSVRKLEDAHPLGVDHLVAPIPNADHEPGSYYDLPLLKPPTWIWTIPTYFFVGGLSGAASALGTCAGEFDRDRFATLARDARWIGAAGDMLSAALLIGDLGRPARFLYMLRVFRPTSPMSVGSWILFLSGGANVTGAVLHRRRGLLGSLARAGERVGGALGLPLAAYTAVLVANTAVPIWSRGRRALPWMFVCSAMASACAVLGAMERPAREHEVLRRLGAMAQAGVLASSLAFEHEAGADDPRVTEPLRNGMAGTLWRSATILGVASLALTLVPTRRRSLRIATGVLGALASVTMRFAVFRAGQVSSRDPRAASVQPEASSASTGTTSGELVLPESAMSISV